MLSVPRLDMIDIVGDVRDPESNPNFYLLGIAREGREDEVIAKCPRTYLVAKLLLVVWKRCLRRSRQGSGSAQGESTCSRTFQEWIVVGRREEAKQASKKAARSRQRHTREGHAHRTKTLIREDAQCQEPPAELGSWRLSDPDVDDDSDEQRGPWTAGAQSRSRA